MSENFDRCLINLFIFVNNDINKYVDLNLMNFKFIQQNGNILYLNIFVN